ncbi:MAG: hypothetical protein EXR75_16950, partial [Myxococcales bacterium]|nr:hypothetical protein [Myxococcales bacterium]
MAERDDEVELRWLRGEYERLRGGDPFTVLGVDVLSDADSVRSAFLGLTKRFHPTRFALGSDDVRLYANELFLEIRRAYKQVAETDGRER